MKVPHHLFERIPGSADPALADGILPLAVAGISTYLANVPEVRALWVHFGRLGRSLPPEVLPRLPDVEVKPLTRVGADARGPREATRPLPEALGPSVGIEPIDSPGEYRPGGQAGGFSAHVAPPRRFEPRGSLDLLRSAVEVAEDDRGDR